MNPPEEYRFCPRCGEKLTLKRLKLHEPERLFCESCEFVFYLDPKVAAGVIVELDGGIVLLKRAISPAYGKWVFPGGFVDVGETVPDAAAREAWEEARLNVEVGTLIGVYSYEGSSVIVVVYRGEYLNGTLTAHDESLKAAVFPKDRIPWNDLAFPSTKDALKDYLGGDDGPGAGKNSSE